MEATHHLHLAFGLLMITNEPLTRHMKFGKERVNIQILYEVLLTGLG
jgi:hypothetical protein